MQTWVKEEPLVQEVVHEWEDRVAKSVVEEKKIVCAARW